MALGWSFWTIVQEETVSETLRERVNSCSRIVWYSGAYHLPKEYKLTGRQWQDYQEFKQGWADFSRQYGEVNRIVKALSTSNANDVLTQIDKLRHTYCPAMFCDVPVELPDMAYIYTAVDNMDEVLYVGRTQNPRARMTDHAKTAHWADECAFVLWDLVPRSEAVAKELETIRKHRPPYNIKGV